RTRHLEDALACEREALDRAVGVDAGPRPVARPAVHVLDRRLHLLRRQHLERREAEERPRVALDDPPHQAAHLLAAEPVAPPRYLRPPAPTPRRTGLDGA